MQKKIGNLLVLAFLAPLAAVGQSAAPSREADAVSAAKKAVALAETGRCREALPLLRKTVRQSLADKELQRQAGVLGIRCGLNLDQPDAVGEFLSSLERNFPHDPEVLYVAVHAYSDLSTRAALDLARSAPSSAQAHELNAEALEMQGKWDEAEKEYDTILEQNPGLVGIHYRKARIYLSEPNADASALDKAKEELKKELEIDPKNAGAEYLLGELGRQAQDWDVAVDHFSRATKLNNSFGEAFLGLGMALNAQSRFADAIAPLETAVKLQPGNPTSHFQLTIAYTRLGRKDDAQKEMAIYQTLSDQALKQMHGEAPSQQPPAANPQ